MVKGAGTIEVLYFNMVNLIAGKYVTGRYFEFENFAERARIVRQDSIWMNIIGHCEPLKSASKWYSVDTYFSMI